MIGFWAILEKRLNWLSAAVMLLPFVSIPGTFTAAILWTLAWLSVPHKTEIFRRTAFSLLFILPAALFYIWPLAPWSERYTSEAQGWTGLRITPAGSLLQISGVVQMGLAVLGIYKTTGLFRKISVVALIYAPFTLFLIGNEPIDNLITVAGNITMYKFVFIVFMIALWNKRAYIPNIVVGLWIIVGVSTFMWALPHLATGTLLRVTPEYYKTHRIYESRPMADSASYFRQEPAPFLNANGTVYYRNEQLTRFVPEDKEYILLTARDKELRVRVVDNEIIVIN